MSSTTRGSNDTRNELLPHQTAFVETVLNPSGKRVVLLRADVGVGKSTALAALAGRLLQAKPAARVLVLVPGSLREQFRGMLRKVGASAVLVDRYRFRELFDSASGPEIWPRGAITILTPGFAQQADILESLSQTGWDLVIADEAYGRGAKADTMRRLARSANRVVIASSTIPELNEADLSGGDDPTVVEWRLDALVDQDGRVIGSGPRPIVHEVLFALTPPELGLREAVCNLCNVLRKSSESASLIEKVIVRRLDSSPPALEKTLRRFVDKSNASTSLMTRSEYLDDDLSDDHSGSQLHSDFTAEVARIARQVLEKIEQTSVDSKLAEFGALSDRLSNQPSRRRVCILTDYLETLFYLTAEIENRGLTSVELHGGMSIEHRERSLAAFAQSEGLLVATIAVIKGMELDATDLVLFDVPDSVTRLHVILSRFRQLRRQNPLHIYVIIRSNGTEGPQRSWRDLLEDLDADQ